MLKLNSDMFTESAKSKAPANIALQILIFIAVFIVIMIAEGIGSVVFIIPAMLKELLASGTDTMTFSESYAMTESLMNDWHYMIPTLIATIFGTILSVIYCRFIESRSLRSMGIKKEKAVPDYLCGIAIGFVLMTVITLLSALTGVNKISVSDNIPVGIILFYLLGWFIQGMSEEFIFRGYLMNSIGGKHSVALAISVSSIAFAFAHSTNPGFGILPIINLFLFAAFAGLYIICTGNIWGACAIHSIWNFTQGNIYGLSVSGTGNINTVLVTEPVSSNAFLTGGTFGIEGSIFTTIVMIAAIVIVLFKIKKQSEKEA